MHNDMHTILTISQADRRPMYLQIMEQVKQRVASGDWAPGQEIPSIRSLAVDTRVSVITIKRAYLELEREGIIVTRQGRGTFVADNVDLSQNLQLQELDQRLQSAVRLARQLAVPEAELERRWQQAKTEQDS